MDLRAREARAEGRELRRVHRWVPYSRISPHLKRAVLVAEDAGFWGHEGIDLVEIRKALESGESVTSDARREHHHAAARQEPVPVAVAQSVSKADRTVHHAPARARAEQDAHLRALSQQHRVGRRHLGRRGGRAHVLRNPGIGSRARPGRADGRRHRQSARAEHREGPMRAFAGVSASSARAWETITPPPIIARACAGREQPCARADRKRGRIAPEEPTPATVA